MLHYVQRRTVRRYFWSVVPFIVLLSLLVAIPQMHVYAGAGAACDGNNLLVSWDSLNTPVSVVVNGNTVVAAGAASGSTLVVGPGSWTVDVFQAGDPVGTYNASCPGGPEATRDPRRINNGSDAGLNVPYRLPDGGFDLWTYDPLTQTGKLLVQIPCEQQKAVARQLAWQQSEGQSPHVSLFEGSDAFGRAVQVFFVWPDQITVSGFFADGKPHTFSFPACVDARTIDPRDPTNTPTPSPTFTPTATFTHTPSFSVRVQPYCSGNQGRAAFSISYFGDDLPASVAWTITVDGQQVRNGSSGFDLRRRSVTVASGRYGTVTLTVNSSPAASASITCQPPTVPKLIIVQPRCTVQGWVTYIIQNDGANMETRGVIRIFHEKSFVQSRFFGPLVQGGAQGFDVGPFTKVGKVTIEVRANANEGDDKTTIATVDCLRPS